MSRTRYVILGDGAAGITAAQGIRENDPAADIKIVSDDPHPAYYRAALTNYLLGELRDEQIWAVPPTFFADVAAERILSRVTTVDTQRAHVWLQNGTPLPYDRLLIGTGARARPAPFEGAQLPGVATLRTLRDTRWMMDLIKLHGLKRAVVIGGGPLALEWALAMRERGVQITILVRERVLMPGALDEVASDLLLARLRQGGIDLRVQEEVQMALPGGNGGVGAVRTKSGETIPCELVAVGIGVMCNTEFLQGSGVTLGRRNGVAVDDRLRSSAPNVYAAGDVAEVNGTLIQLWEPARLQARVAAANMTGRDRVYAPGVQYFATRLFDLDFASLGSVAREAPTPSPQGGMRQEYVDAPRGGGRIAYRKVVVRDGKLVGALMLGDRESRVRQRGRLFKRLIDEKIDVTSIAQQLLDPDFDLAAWLRTSRGLVEKPAASIPAAGVIAGAQLRGTQHVNLHDLGAAPITRRPKPEAAAAAAAGPASAPIGFGTFPAAASALPPGIGIAAHEPPKPGATIFSLGLRAPNPLNVTAGPASVMARPAYLEGVGRRFDLSGVVSIGRDPRGTIALQDPGVSHVHAQITAHGAALFLRDLGSRNGTWVNGAQVTVPHLLREGDKITVGTTELVFRTGPSGHAPVSAPKPASAPAPAPAPYAAMPASSIGAPPPTNQVAMPVPAPTPSRVDTTTAALVGTSGAFAGKRFDVPTSPSTIGRDMAAQVRIEELSISRRHAVLTNVEGRWFLSDLHSSAGTMHNGVRVTPGQEVPLRDGDTLQLGVVIVQFRG
jgi:NADPH-dependent 2,4-dienoyl-CoA reductase/sulfur reductase-like enzyme/pSer/pThr/pTyr-binding forkhead associated (FHA) protein